MPAVVRIFVLGSGSSGNCLIVEVDGERLVIDAGIGPMRATERMRALGSEFITSRAPHGVFVTHDHGDHSSHALPLARCLRAPIYAHKGVALDRARRRVDVRPYEPGVPVIAGPFQVEALHIPHDAPQVALRVTAGDRRFAIATDLGHPTPALRSMLAGCDLVMLESNHCPHLLEHGPYPPRLKQRVAGHLGHLANEQAAALAATLENTRVSDLVLSHISRTNNTPERALAVVGARLQRVRVQALPNGTARRLDVVQGNRLAAAEQLGFGF